MKSYKTSTETEYKSMSTDIINKRRTTLSSQSKVITIKNTHEFKHCRSHDLSLTPHRQYPDSV